MSSSIPTLRDIRAAAERIAPYAHRTPVLSCESLNGIVGYRVNHNLDLHLGPITIQRTGAR